MNKKRIFAAAVIICFLIMIQQHQVREQKIADSPIDIETAYEMLNQDIFGNRTIDWYSDTLEKEVHEYSKEVKAEFVSVEYDGNLFPPELVAMMEEELYQLEKTDWEIDDTWYDAWYEILDVFGARDFIPGLDDLYQLFPELNVHRDEIETVYDAYHYIMPDIINIEEIFHFSMEPGKDNYVFVYEAEGTIIEYFVRLTERIGDKFVTVDEFETRNYGVQVEVRDQQIYVTTPCCVVGVECPYTVSDQGYWDETGRLHFMGRGDHMINVHGHKVSLWHIEKVLMEQPEIQSAVVLNLPSQKFCHKQQERWHTASQCGGRLGSYSESYEIRVAFVVLQDHRQIDSCGPTTRYADNANLERINMFRERLRYHLSGYEMPGRFVVLQEIPYRENGKVDTEKLQEIWIQERIREKPHEI